MPELIHEHSHRVLGADGTRYSVRVCGERREDGTWVAWLEFVPVDPSQRPLRTGRETSQPNRAAVEYWATGLEPVYLEGALERARR